MHISRIKVKNWRNFRDMDADLSTTTYLIGPNASGKSNFLDIFRFMRDVVNPNGGGLQQAVSSRGDMKKLRCLAGRESRGITLEFEFKESSQDKEPIWKYNLSFANETSGTRRAEVLHEIVTYQGDEILNRPNDEDREDPERLTETYLQLTNSNKEFREIAKFFEKTLYLHLVPQLLKYSELSLSGPLESDPFGQGFLEQIAATNQNTRKSRLRKTEEILRKVIPYFKELRFVKDKQSGKPHLEMSYVHWRKNDARQREDQFSDGTLRLIALLWTIMSSDNLILLEEPELSLHRKVVEQIPRMLSTAQRSRKKARNQVLISTHSPALLSEDSIDGEFLILTPGEKGESTTVETPTPDDLEALRAGMSPADVLLPKTGIAVGDL